MKRVIIFDDHMVTLEQSMDYGSVCSMPTTIFTIYGFPHTITEMPLEDFEKQIQDEVWETARKIECPLSMWPEVYSTKDLYSIFGTSIPDEVLVKESAQSAIKKIKDYEIKKNEEKEQKISEKALKVKLAILEYANVKNLTYEDAKDELYMEDYV